MREIKLTKYSEAWYERYIVRRRKIIWITIFNALLIVLETYGILMAFAGDAETGGTAICLGIPYAYCAYIVYRVITNNQNDCYEEYINKLIRKEKRHGDKQKKWVM